MDSRTSGGGDSKNGSKWESKSLRSRRTKGWKIGEHKCSKWRSKGLGMKGEKEGKSENKMGRSKRVGSR